MKNISSNVRSNDTNSMYLPTKAEGIAVCSVFIVADVFIVSGNLLTLVLFALSKQLRKRSIFLVINMAFSDLLLGILTLPIYIVMKGNSYRLWNFKRSRNVTRSFSFVDTALSQASLLSAAFISLERFHAIFWPLKHRTLSLQAYRVGISVVWVLSILVSTIFNLLLWLKSAKECLYFWIPYAVTILLLLCSCNIGIWRKSLHRAVVSQQNIVNSQRLTKTLLFVSMLALICWLPLVVTNYLYYVHEISASWLTLASSVANILNYINSCVNPVIYAFKIPEFKRALPFLAAGKKEVPTVMKDKSSEKSGARVLAFDNQDMDTKL
ncbi:growth hormone secretagogue receptor type 1-like [Montipora capricornis]|uniref:growth hormone secretagogue receptor type 1-like n=1 Tax=Montipora capricornis TaxID=246305 RepID=UPI0035F1D4B3